MLAARDVNEPTTQHCVTLYLPHCHFFVFSPPYKAGPFGKRVVGFIVWSDDEHQRKEETIIEIYLKCLAVLCRRFVDISRSQHHFNADKITEGGTF